MSEKFEPFSFVKDDTDSKSQSNLKDGKDFIDLDNNKEKGLKSKNNGKFISLGESLGYAKDDIYSTKVESDNTISSYDSSNESNLSSEASEDTPVDKDELHLKQIEEITAKHNQEIDDLKKDFEAQTQEIKKSGYDEAKKDYHSKNEEEAMSLLAVIEKEISRISLTQEEWLQKYSFEVAELVTTLLKRILPVYEKENGDKEIITFVKQVLSYVVDKPKLQIQLPRDSAHLAKEISTMLKKAGAGFSRKDEGLGFQIVTNGILSNSDCVIKWQEGLISRKMSDLWKEIDETIDEIKNLSKKSNS